MSGILQARSSEGHGPDRDASADRAPRFVFMLTHDDLTVANARELVPAVQAAGVRYAGAKDLGLPTEELVGLFGDLRAAGCTTFLEVVSETPDAMVASARAALTVRPDYLVGGTAIEATLPILAGTGIRFMPYVGRIVGHPCLLRGSVDEIVADARRAEAAGVDGINLLAYRYDGDVEALVRAIVASVRVPVLSAGSIDSDARIEAMRRLGVWGFTVGTAALDGAFVAGGDLTAQLRQVLALAGGAQS
jgi:hypothetical protein